MDEHRSAGWAEGPGAPEKPLGRGLEDVSHLFLSPPAPGMPAGRSGMGPPSERHEARSRTGASVTPLQRIETVTRVQLTALLRDRNVGLEEGLTVLDDSVPCPPCGEIDLLALDRAHLLTIVDVDIAPNDELLLRGVSHVDWVVRNLPNVRRMYSGRAINFSATPRLLLLAPEFSEACARVAQAIGHTPIELVRYHVVHLPGGFGVLFERVKPL